MDTNDHYAEDAKSCCRRIANHRYIESDRQLFKAISQWSKHKWNKGYIGMGATYNQGIWVSDFWEYGNTCSVTAIDETYNSYSF